MKPIAFRPVALFWIGLIPIAAIGIVAGGAPCAQAAPLRAGVAKVDISSPDAGPPNGPMYAKALVLSDGTTTAVIATVDAVAIAEIGGIRNEYLATVRAQVQKELQIPPLNVAVNASHCHGIVCADVAERTVTLDYNERYTASDYSQHVF